jgi:uncharacterized protein (TIGR03437 family)
MTDRPITSDQWGYYQIEANVANNSADIAFGFIFIGTGQAWVDDASFQIIGDAGPANLDFEAGPVGQPPSGWTPPATGFTTVVVDQNCTQGQFCARLGGAGSSAVAPGNLWQSIPADAYLSRQFLLRAAVRVEGPGTSVRMSFRAVRADGSYSSFDAGTAYPITSSQWNYYQTGGYVSSDSLQIIFGFQIVGPGAAWVDDVSLGVADAPAEPPRALDDAGLANLAAFAKVLGYVRHFHPSDQAAQVNWDVFAVQGVRAVESAATPQDLAGKLQALFGPIAPTVQIYTTGNAPVPPAELHPASLDGLSEVRWNNFGVGLGGSPTYHSERQSAPVSGGALPAAYQDPAQPYQAEIGRGLSVSVPLTLYADAQGTLPHGSYQPPTDVLVGAANDRATRLAGVMLAWNVFQHFYPYFDVVDTDWPGTLMQALGTAAIDTGLANYTRTLERLDAAAKDGHGAFSGTGAAIFSVPLAWDWVENQLVVTWVAAANTQGVARGDRVLSIDGQSTEDAMAAWQPLIPAATPQWNLWNTVQRIGYCDSQTRQMQLEIEPYASPGSRRTVQFPCVAGAMPGEPRGNTVQELEPGIFYLDLNRVTPQIWSQALPQLASAAGIIFDLRGYPQTLNYLQNLSQTSLNSEQFYVPTPAKPDRAGLTFAPVGWSLPPAQPFLNGRRVFLTDDRAISFAETVMGIVEYYKLAEIVGGRTAGTNGDINPFTVAGSFTMVWTDLKVLKQDGSQHHGVGIAPTIPTARTRQAIANGIDEVLAKGLEIVKGPKPGPAPAITAAGIGNAATFNGGPVAPGEMVTIFGSGLGPSQLTLTGYDISGHLANYAGETRVFFDGIQAPLVYTSSTQVSAIVPYQAAATTKVRVEYQGRSSNEVTLPVAAFAPGIFAAGSGPQAQALNQDNSVISASNPAGRGEIITLYITGEGQTTPAGINGKLAAAGKWPTAAGNLTVMIGGAQAAVRYQGEVYAGVMQLNVQVPAGAPAGNAVPLVVSVGGVASAGNRTIAVK